MPNPIRISMQSAYAIVLDNGHVIAVLATEADFARSFARSYAKAFKVHTRVCNARNVNGDVSRKSLDAGNYWPASI